MFSDLLADVTALLMRDAALDLGRQIREELFAVCSALSFGITAPVVETGDAHSSASASSMRCQHGGKMDYG